MTDVRGTETADDRMHAAGSATDAPAPLPGDPVEARLPVRQAVPLACQHLLAAYASIVVTPLVLADALGWGAGEITLVLAAGLVSSGLCTLIQCLGLPGVNVGTRLPVFQGTTIAAVPPLVAIGASGDITALFGTTIAAGGFCLAATPLWSRLLGLFPPLVTGTVIAVIGVSLMPVAVMWLGGGVGFGAHAVAPGDLVLGFGTLVVVVAMMRFARGFYKRIAILAGLVLGSIAAAMAGRIDLTPVADAAWFAAPLPFAFGAPSFPPAGVLAMVLAMIVTMIESTGDYLAVGEICERPIDRQRLAAGLKAEGLGTILGGCLNSFPYTTFSQNVGVIRVSGVRSRFVVAQAAFGLIVIGFVPKLSALAACIPSPVLGGCGLVLFGSIACTGIETIGRAEADDDRRIVVVGTSLGLAMLTIANPGFFDALPRSVAVVLGNPITLGGFAAVAMNRLFTAAPPSAPPV